MDIVIDDGVVSPETEGEIRSVLHRLSVGNDKDGWHALPKQLHLVRCLRGGRSGSEVYEAHAWPETMVVVKVGPAYQLKDEYSNYKKYLSGKSQSNLFAPIVAVTRGLRDESQMPGLREAVVYTHVSKYDGSTSKTQTFEEVCKKAINSGGLDLDPVIKALNRLFAAARMDLYRDWEVEETTLRNQWNLRLGIDAVIEVHQFNSSERSFEYKDCGTVTTQVWPHDVVDSASRLDGRIRSGMIVDLVGLEARWWDHRLIGEHLNEGVRGEPVRIEIVASDNQTISDLAKTLEQGAQFSIRGKVRSTRAELHHNLLVTSLKELEWSPSLIEHRETITPNPFSALPKLLKQKPTQHITALVHGDLNPRNILVVPDGQYLRPYLIDFAFTNPGEPFFSDFIRLECTLARDVLPSELSWSQHVRLQRLLSLACRMDEGQVAERFCALLAQEHKSLIPAFRVFYTIRRGAQQAYPEAHRAAWYREYMEQLFLFSHVTLKWEEQSQAALRASTAIAAVAAEAFCSQDLFRTWNLKELRCDGTEFINILSQRPERSLKELSGLTLALDQHRIKLSDPLVTQLENARSAFVKHAFRVEANEANLALQKDHRVFISLRAYIGLKGKIHPGRIRYRASPENMLDNDELLAASAELRSGEGHDDVLQLISAHKAVVLIGDAGSGKSTVSYELKYQLALSILNRGVYTPRLPIVLRARDVSDWLEKTAEKEISLRSGVEALESQGLSASDKTTLKTSIVETLERCSDLDRKEATSDLLTTGSVYLIVDALNEVPEKLKQKVADWLVLLEALYPRTPLLVCHREYNYVPGLLPFPVITLQKVTDEQARRFIEKYLEEIETPNYQQLAQRLIQLLLNDPLQEKVRDLARTPLFLKLLVDHYLKTATLPTSRARLLEDFSRGYLEDHSKITRGASTANYSYEDKCRLLGVLAHKLVQDGITDLPEKDIPDLIAEDLKGEALGDRWQQLLEIIIDSEMLERNGNSLRFLHQSFQEFFAARYLLKHAPRNTTAIHEKMLGVRWHDTFTILASYGDEDREIVSDVIEAALSIDPMLTARCLRMAEGVDQELLDRFVKRQEDTLRSESGTFARIRAAIVLAEHGRGPTRATLLRIASDPSAPSESRVEVLKQLAAIPGQVRFEQMKGRVESELVNVLKKICVEPAPLEVHKAGIAAIGSAGLKDLSGFLFDFLAEENWELQYEAWNRIRDLKIEWIPRQQRAAFMRACEARLPLADSELFRTSVTGRMDELKYERIMILEQLASLEKLPLVLNHRFRLDIAHAVRRIVDEITLMAGDPPAEAKEAWSVLREPISGKPKQLSRWFKLIRDGDNATAAAAAHRLVQIPESLPYDELASLLDARLPPDRLMAVAQLASSSGDRRLSEPLESLVQELVKTVDSHESVEALATVMFALLDIDSHRGTRLGLVLDSNFWSGYGGVTPAWFPWTRVFDRFYPNNRDYEILLTQERDGTRAVVHWLFSKAAIHLVTAYQITPTELGDLSLKLFRESAEKETELRWHHYYSGTAANLHAVDLLPWLLKIAGNPMLEGLSTKYSHQRFGVFSERQLAMVFRAIGFLARVSIDSKKPEHGIAAQAQLREWYAALPTKPERSLLVGLTTALAYLGEWEPIMTHLSSSEEWMHEAVDNTFRYWLPKDRKRDLEERDRAARWIKKRLELPGLKPEVRSTLERTKDRLEEKLRYHV